MACQGAGQSSGERRLRATGGMRRRRSTPMNTPCPPLPASACLPHLGLWVHLQHPHGRRDHGGQGGAVHVGIKDAHLRPGGGVFVRFVQAARGAAGESACTRRRAGRGQATRHSEGQPRLWPTAAAPAAQRSTHLGPHLRQRVGQVDCGGGLAHACGAWGGAPEQRCRLTRPAAASVRYAQVERHAPAASQRAPARTALAGGDSDDVGHAAQPAGPPVVRQQRRRRPCVHLEFQARHPRQRTHVVARLWAAAGAGEMGCGAPARRAGAAGQRSSNGLGQLQARLHSMLPGRAVRPRRCPRRAPPAQSHP